MLTFDLKTQSQNISFDFKDVIGGGGGGTPLPYYDGAYTVTPKITEQVLATKNKSMANNVTVLKIPKTETHNTHGTTLTIGSV